MVTRTSAKNGPSKVGGLAMLLVMGRAADESLDNAGDKVQVMVGVVADATAQSLPRGIF